MLPGYHTQNLVSEIYRLTENVSKQGEETRPAAFDWLDKYKSSGKLPSYYWELITISRNIYGFPYHVLTNMTGPYHRQNTRNCLITMKLLT